MALYDAVLFRSPASSSPWQPPAGPSPESRPSSVDISRRPPSCSPWTPGLAASRSLVAEVSTLCDLAERLTDGRLHEDALSKLPDDEFIAELTAFPASALDGRRRPTHCPRPGRLGAARRPRAAQGRPGHIPDRPSPHPERDPRNRREMAPLSQPRHQLPIPGRVRPTGSTPRSGFGSNP